MIGQFDCHVGFERLGDDVLDGLPDFGDDEF